MTIQDPETSRERPVHTPARKPYEKPQLQVFGDLTEITKSVNGTRMSDGAAHPNMHFTS